MADSKIGIRNVYKIFGEQWRRALALAQDGIDKADVLARTGCTIGLNNISLDIAAGEIFVVMGLSGSGKSTLVRHINRLIDPSAGAIEVNGHNILEFDRRALRHLRRHSISMVFQGFGLLPHKTVLDNAAFALRTRGDDRRAAVALAREWLVRVGLEGYENKYPDELSGGMRQRVGLARALAADTDIVLMDEPFSALDPLIRGEMQDQLLQLQAGLRKTIVFITHDPGEAFKLGNRIALLRDGKLVQAGRPADLLAHPADDYVSRFVEGQRTGGGRNGP
ncbi:proline/glycine betaine ABC transporter ATP-binding protein [Pandoraea terrae]|uniref:Quaternary amine transport ATP-binding protein n=1 Tax=Pandoraea terrae TaxID=1537710 RepID=A0A5E4WA47_9BURK|nr:betaine/proline/choline family ABC transporter ATP-binding protein [Pandoraea terrae]VVE20160.1 proline/glycine betaine ABC transporter ATP-binding protein [Pandoraea terrae]